MAAIGASKKPDIAEAKREALLDEAIAAFRTMLIADPGLVRVRLELARAFFLKGEDTLATRHFEQVLAGKPPASVVLNVNRFLSRMRARKRWSVRVGMALAPDSNISSRSEERTIVLDTPIGRLPFTFQAEDKPESGIGISVWAGGEYQYPLEDRWQLRAGADMSRRDYRSGEFDQMTVSGHVGPRWLIGRVTDASLLANVRQHWLSDEAEFRDLGIRVEVRHRLNRADDGEPRRFPATNAATTNERISTGRSPMSRRASAGWRRRRCVSTRRRAGGARGRNASASAIRGGWVRLGVTAHLPWGFTVGGAGTLRWTDYPADWSPFVLGGGPRGDLTRSFRLNVYNRGFTLAGFSPQISLVKEQRTSNAQLHDYKRLYGELRFVRQF